MHADIDASLRKVSPHQPPVAAFCTQQSPIFIPATSIMVTEAVDTRTTMLLFCPAVEATYGADDVLHPVPGVVVVCGPQ